MGNDKYISLIDDEIYFSMRTITICSSIRYIELIKSTIREMELHDIRGVFPNMVFEPEGSELSLLEMRKLQKDHFESILSSDAVYVINPKGYIGTMVSAEIGFSIGVGKAVYYSENCSEIDLKALATGIISVNEIEKFKKMNRNTTPDNR